MNKLEYFNLIKIDNLSNGEYYLCFDNEVTEFKKVPPVPVKKRPL